MRVTAQFVWVMILALLAVGVLAAPASAQWYPYPSYPYPTYPYPAYSYYGVPTGSYVPPYYWWSKLLLQSADDDVVLPVLQSVEQPVLLPVPRLSELLPGLVDKAPSVAGMIFRAS